MKIMHYTLYATKKRFARIVSDKNGKLSLEELMAGMPKPEK